MTAMATAMRLGIIQSSYVPWRGYFDFIDDVDLFLFFDDTDYTPRSWRNRNRIKTANGAIWLSVPVLHTRGVLIEKAEIDYTNRWVDKHILSLSQAYAKAPHFADYSPALFAALSAGHRTISELNVAVTRIIMQMLAIHTPTRMASDLSAQGSKDERLVDLARKAGASVYLSGPSAKGYIRPQLFADAKIDLEYKTYDYPEYPQLHGPFEPQVTVLDLIFNCGPRSREFLKSRVPNEAGSR